MHPTHMDIKQLTTEAERSARADKWERSIAYSNLALIKQNKRLIDDLYEIDFKLHQIRTGDNG